LLVPFSRSWRIVNSELLALRQCGGTLNDPAASTVAGTADFRHDSRRHSMRRLDVSEADSVGGGDAAQSSYDAGHSIGTAVGYAVLVIRAGTGDLASAAVLVNKLF
jgi:hypothetical protein